MCTACFEYIVPSEDETYTTPDSTTVMNTILNVAGCDSITTITLTIDTLNNAVSNNFNIDTLITGETNQSLDVFSWLPNFGYKSR